MYKKLFKNNQVTYGRPYQVKLPDSLIKFTDAEDSNDQEDPSELSPEELLKRAEKKSRDIIAEAEAEAKNLMEQARAKAEEEAKAIGEEAWQRGYAEGMEAAALQNKSLLEEAERIKQSASEEYEKILAGMGADILELPSGYREGSSQQTQNEQGCDTSAGERALAECSEKRRCHQGIAGGL